MMHGGNLKLAAKYFLMIFFLTSIQLYPFLSTYFVNLYPTGWVFKFWRIIYEKHVIRIAKYKIMK
jgi:hypothetical protein